MDSKAPFTHIYAYYNNYKSMGLVFLIQYLNGVRITFCR